MKLGELLYYCDAINKFIVNKPLSLICLAGDDYPRVHVFHEEDFDSIPGDEFIKPDEEYERKRKIFQNIEFEFLVWKGAKDA